MRSGSCGVERNPAEFRTILVEDRIIVKIALAVNPCARKGSESFSRK
jgi:hypothetical protein